jgi:hypothetical protein
MAQARVYHLDLERAWAGGWPGPRGGGGPRGAGGMAGGWEGAGRCKGVDEVLGNDSSSPVVCACW